MNRILNKRVKIIAIMVVSLMVVSIGLSFAYISGHSIGNESTSTVALKGGNITIHYTNNSGTIVASDIVPGYEVTKKFTITSDFGGKDYYTSGVWYTVALIIDKNTFDDNSIKFSISLDDSSGTDGITMANRTDIGILNGSNATHAIIGSGRFSGNNISHVYNLKISYPYRKANQSHEENCEFNGHIDIIDSDFIKLGIDLKGGNFDDIDLYNNSIEVPANSVINLPSPKKEGYNFIGWEIKSGNVNIDNGIISTNETDASIESLWVKSSYEYDYTGGEQNFIADVGGYYKIEAWGAQGGSVTYSSTLYRGGYGGYSTGIANFAKGQKIYIYIGGSGSGGISSSSYSGGYNGGGSTNGTSGTDHYHSSGGGATHVALNTYGDGQLVNFENYISDIIIVSGGGGGGYTHTTSTAYSSIGGEGGGFNGTDSTVDSKNGKQGLGGTQSAGGKYMGASETTSTIFGSFGLGGKPSASFGSAGGGGYYGGGASYGNTSSNGNSGGGGGSGYIGNSLLTDKYMYCYNCTTSDATDTKTYTTTCVQESPTTDCAKKGNGFVRITYLHS